jgi:two-component sensor histidine kinase
MTMSQKVHFLDGGGEMASAIRAHDWSSSELGSPDDWPTALKTVVGITLNAKFPKCVVWGPNLITIHNDAFRPILGTKPPALGRSFRDVWSEAWAEIGPIAERAYAGEATFIEDFPLVIDRYGYPEQAYFTFCYSPIRDEKGNVRGMMDTVIETTAKVEAQRQSRLLNRELEHRIKNTLTVVSAIVNQSLQPAAADPKARAALLQRISALGQAQSLLTRSDLAEANIHDVVDESLAPFRTDDDRIQVNGPPVMLSSKQALTLALAVNELATNAVKYGALSNETGRVQVLWQVGPPGTEDPFHFSWIEIGGPPPDASARKGFGSLIIERVLAQDFSGQTALVHDPSGIRCELTTQMRHIGESPSTAA